MKKKALQYLVLLFAWSGLLINGAEAQTADFTYSQVGGSGAFCGSTSEPVTVQFFGDGSASSWDWDFGNGSTSTLQEPVVTFDPGAYTVTLEIDGGADSHSETVNIFQKPTVGFSVSDTLVCTSELISFSDASTEGDGTLTEWVWTYFDGNVDSAQNTTHAYSVTGTYDVKLEVFDDNGCRVSLKKDDLITVEEGPVAAFSVSPSSGCELPFDVSVSNSSSNADSYLWDFGDGTAIDSSDNPSTHTYSSFGSYDILLTAEANNGCVDTAVQTVSVEDFEANFSVDTDRQCLGYTFSFADQSSTGAASWAWDFGDGNGSTSQNPTHTYATDGTYDVQLIAEHALGCSDTVTMTGAVIVHPLPDVGFTVDDQTDCQVPFSPAFSDTTGNIASWEWTFGNGDTATIQTPSTTYNSFGSFDVELNVVDNNGCEGSLTKSGYISISEPVAGISSDVVEGCVNLDVTFSDASNTNDPVTSWEWDFGDGVSAGPGSGIISGVSNTSGTFDQPLHTYTDTGVYTVSLTINTSSGCTADTTMTNYIQAGLSPEANFSPTDTSGCHPFEVLFTDLSDTIADRWEWDFGGAGGSTQQNPTHEFTDTGYFYVSLIAYHNGCPGDTSVDSAVQVFPAKAIIGSVDEPVGCDTPHVVTFTDTSQGADGWIWEFGDGDSFSGQTPPPHTYDSIGTYTVLLIASNSTFGCTDTTSTTIQVSEIIPGFEALDTTNGCSPYTVSFSDTSKSSPSFSITDWRWEFGDGIGTSLNSGNITGVSQTTGTFDSPVHTFADSGAYTVRVIVQDNIGCIDTLDKADLVNVYAHPRPRFTADVMDGCVPLIVNFTDAVAFVYAADSLFWDFGDGSPADTSQETESISHTFASRGQYDVTLTVIDTNGCDSTLTFTDTINATMPYPGFSFDNVICDSSSVVFSNSSTGSGLSYQWDFGDDSTSTDVTPAHNYALGVDTTTFLTVELLVTDSNGCDSTMQSTMTISKPVAEFTTGSTSADCPPFNASFFDASSNDVNGWQWDFGDNTPFNVLEDPVHSYEDPGFYGVSLQVTNTEGCTDVIEKDSLIEVNGPTGSFTYSENAVTCSQEFTFEAVAANASTMTWVFGDGGSDEGETVVYRYSEEGTYTPILVLDDENGCQITIPATTPLVVDSNDLEVGITTDTNNVFAVIPITFSSTTTSSGNLEELTWIIDGDTIVETTTVPVEYTFDDVGTYPAELIVLDDRGCIDSASTTVTVVEGIEYPTVFTPNGDGINDELLIRNSGVISFTITIWNRWGELIFESEAPDITWDGRTFSGEDAAEGTYYFVLDYELVSGDKPAEPIKGVITLIR